MIRAARFLTATALVALTLACGGDGPNAPAGVPASLDLRALPDTAGVGDSIVPDVRVLDGRGHVVASSEVQITSSASFVLAVLPNGALRALSEGEAIVRAVAGDARDSAVVVVRRLPRELGIALADSIEFGTTQVIQPNVVVWDGLGNPMPLPPGLRFSSSDTSILRVDSTTGAATVVNAGWARIIATLGGLQKSARIEVALYEPFAGLGEIAQLSTGRHVTCAKTTAGPSYCQTAAGRSLAGTVGGNQTVPLSPVSTPAPLVSIGTGFDASCGLTAAGDAYCWGTGLLPLTGSNALVATPTAMPKPDGVTAWTGLAFNHRSTDHCLLDQSARAWCWGTNQNGAIGSSLGFYAGLRPLDGTPPAFTKVRTSLVHGCGMTAANELWCWGDETAYDRDHGYFNGLNPVRIVLPRAIRDFATTFQGTCVLYVEGDVECWGYNQVRSLGLPASDAPLLPARVQMPGKFVSLHSGGVGSCALSDTGELWCWGALKGFDPNGVAPFRFAPREVFSDASLASTGLVALLCARTTTGRVLCTTREDAR